MISSSPSRRALLAGAAAIPTAALAALPVFTDPTEARLEALYAEWHGLWYADFAAYPFDEQDAAVDANSVRCQAIEREIMATRVSTPRAFLVKLRFAEEAETNGPPWNPETGSIDLTRDAVTSLIADMEWLIGGAA
jgi:hypothetical protein